MNEKLNATKVIAGKDASDAVAFNFFNPRFQRVEFIYSSYHNEKLLSDFLAKKNKSWESTVSLGISFLAIKRKFTPIT